LHRKGYQAKTIGVKLRYDDFRIVTREQTLQAHTSDANIIRQAAGRCLKKAMLERRLRLLGVRAGNLCRPDTVALAASVENQGERDQLLLPMFEANSQGTTPV
jgi:DNA polymerase-4